jgi:hypothetical protein
MCDPLVDGVPLAIESLVRDITVRVNIHDPPGPNDPDSGLESCVAQELRLLLKFTDAERVEILLWGAGEEGGCDLATQKKIREISGVVQELIRQLGSKLHVVRGAGQGVVWIHSYWK